ncbi:MAG: hypothetical protein SFW36_01515 [Leptolyngbyaceae cyanobacterium bins.59]|nr:hypothetical protein [Leptolyngbyaceae cyanobacterium bins.59]
MAYFDLDEQRSAHAEQAAEALYLDGSSDAAFAQLPTRVDDDYLSGYIAKLKELPRNPDGTIQHYTPRQHFAYGYMDNPNPCSCDEF